MISNVNFKWVLNYTWNPWNQWTAGTRMCTFTERHILSEFPLSNVILNMLKSLSLVLNNLHYKCGMLLIPSYSTYKQRWNYLRTKLISIIYWINLIKTAVLCPCLTTACNLFECFAASKQYLCILCAVHHLTIVSIKSRARRFIIHFFLSLFPSLHPEPSIRIS